ncbi:MAG: hypothetical protein R3B99_22610 [Polyangiales bacterium]
MRRWCMLLLALGCGDVDAVLELDLGLPADADRVAVVQARRGSVGFEDAWDASGSVAFSLSVAEARSVSIVSDGAYEEPLLVRVRYCSNAACDALGDERAPESRLRIERAFYLGERTFARWNISNVPTDSAPTPDEIGRCEVGGCRDGVAASHCRTDGTHFCE